MGNSSSSSSSSSSPSAKGKEKFKAFEDIVDFIATEYILTMNFESLSKLSEKAYCDNLVVLTTDILQRYFNDMEIDYLAQRVRDGVEVNEMESKRVSFVTKTDLENLDISNDAQKSIKKKRVCIGIAKFYVKIAHIFAAIVMTINPVYSYRDQYGQMVKTPLMNKDKIPKNVDRKIYKLNICDNRIRALQRGEAIDEDTGNVTLQPRVCDMNTPGKTLDDEPGIPELMQLYLDDKYDYSNGTFTGMSRSTEQQYLRDLQRFYTAFTGNKQMPSNYTKFSDIKLREYDQSPACRGATSPRITVNSKDELFIQYAENTKRMIQRAKTNQLKLLDVINDLFSNDRNPFTDKRVIRVNPTLTDEILQKAVERTRNYIINLYVTCENDYVTGTKLFEALVESKISDTTQNQIKNIQRRQDEQIKQAYNLPPGWVSQSNPKVQPQLGPQLGRPPQPQLGPQLGRPASIFGEDEPVGRPVSILGEEQEQQPFGEQPQPLIQPQLAPRSLQPQLAPRSLQPQPAPRSLQSQFRPSSLEPQLAPRSLLGEQLQPSSFRPQSVQQNNNRTMSALGINANEIGPSQGVDLGLNEAEFSHGRYPVSTRYDPRSPAFQVAYRPPTTVRFQ